MNAKPVPPPISDSLWQRVAHILEVSFPPHERGPTAAIRTQIDGGSRVLWTNDGQSVVAITCALTTTEGDVLLEFLAVDPDLRSRGLGGRFLASVLSQTDGPVVLEVEPPEEVRTPEATARIRFYKRQGGVVIPCSRGYAMPNLADQGTFPMLLIEMDADRATELNGESLRNLVTSIWNKAYDRHPNDRELEEVLANLAC